MFTYINLTACAVVHMIWRWISSLVVVFNIFIVCGNKTKFIFNDLTTHSSRENIWGVDLNPTGANDIFCPVLMRKSIIWKYMEVVFAVTTINKKNDPTTNTKMNVDRVLGQFSIHHDISDVTRTMLEFQVISMMDFL